MIHKTTALDPAKLDEILGQADRFIKTKLIPLEKEMALKSWEENLPTLNELRQEARELGLWAPQIPETLGGMGLNLVQHGKLMEVLGQSPFGLYLCNCQAPDAGNMEILMEFGTDSQQEKFLMPLIRGEYRSCFSMTEPDYAGSNPVFMGTTAVKDGDEYVINGKKWFTSSADGADFAIVMVQTSQNADNPYTRASQIIVPTNTPGFIHERKISIMGHEGGGWASHSEITYDNCRVPAENLLGGEGAGFAIAQTRLGPGRIHHCMRWIGICERAFSMMCQRAVSRELAPGKPLASKQTIQHWVAESRAEINAARLMVLEAAQKIDDQGAHAAKVEISVIKFFCADVLRNVLERAVQIFGAMGITDDTPLAFWYAHERGARIYDGADEVHKSRVAREIFKSYGYSSRK